MTNIGDLTAALALQPALKFNGGGHINHTIFWKNLSPTGGGEPQGTVYLEYITYVTCVHELYRKLDFRLFLSQDIYKGIIPPSSLGLPRLRHIIWSLLTRATYGSNH